MSKRERIEALEQKIAELEQRIVLLEARPVVWWQPPYTPSDNDWRKPGWPVDDSGSTCSKPMPVTWRYVC